MQVQNSHLTVIFPQNFEGSATWSSGFPADVFNIRFLFCTFLEDLDFFFFLITFGVQNGDALRDESFMILPVWHSVCSLNLKIEVSLQLRESAYSGMTLLIFSPTGSLFHCFLKTIRSIFEFLLLIHVS